MKIINKSMDLKDLETEEAKRIIKELQDLNKQFEEKGGKISSWYGECEPTKLSRQMSIMNRGYDYIPVVSDKEFDYKYPNFLLWEIYWVCSNLNIKKGDRVLDIGGSCSLFSFYLASKGVKVVAIDVNPKIVEEANKTAKIMGLDYVAVCADAETYVVNTDEKFDFITSICVFEHIEINKRKRIVKNLDKNLKDDGKIAFTFDYKNPSKFVMIDNENDIKSIFLCNKKLQMIENQKFYDNNKNYLILPCYRKPMFFKAKLYYIKHKEMSILDFFKTKDYNDYSFGAIFLKKK